MLKLTRIGESPLPLEADCIVPHALAALSAREVAALPVWHGNAQVPLGEFFRIEGDAADGHVQLSGDCRRVKWVGAGMTSGRLTIEGSIGMHLGAQMRGGAIDVRGDAGDWAGAEMAGGALRIRGNAGNLTGACYRGGRAGMRGGTILVDGSAGHEVGSCLRRGFIAIGGNVGDFAGVSMIAGTLFVFGRAGRRAGAGMKRGTIGLWGDVSELLPTFDDCGPIAPLFLAMYFRALEQAGFSASIGGRPPRCARYRGDPVSRGKGEILTRERA